MGECGNKDPVLGDLLIFQKQLEIWTLIQNLIFMYVATFFFILFSFLDIQEANTVQAKENKSVVLI